MTGGLTSICCTFQRKSESEKEKQEGSDAEHHRSRTGSESSDKGFNKGEKYAQVGTLGFVVKYV